MNLDANKNFNISTGSVFCVPAPVKFALPKEHIDSIINRALAEAELQGIKGKEITPFLLQSIVKETGGESLTTNIAFLLHNANFAASVARELVSVEERHNTCGFSVVIPPANIKKGKHATNNNINHMGFSTVDCVVVGSIAHDITCSLNVSNSLVVPTSYPGQISRSLGGVGYNVTKASILSGKQIGVNTKLISSIGHLELNNTLEDINNEFIEFGGDIFFDPTSISTSKTHKSANYIAFHDSKGELVIACSDMKIVENIDPSFVYHQIKDLRPKCVLFDGNIGKDQQKSVIEASREINAIIGFEPTSTVKAAEIASLPFENPNRLLKDVFPNNHINFATPNVFELSSLHETLLKNEYFDIDNWFPVIDSLSIGSHFKSKMEIFAKKVPEISNLILKDGVPQKAIQILPYVPNLFVKLGSNGLLLFQLILGIEENNKQINQLEEFTSSFSFKEFVAEYFPPMPGKNLGLLIQYYPPFKTPQQAVINVNGAGDTFCGVLLAELGKDKTWLYNNKEKVRILGKAQKAASLTIQSQKSVSEKILSLHDY